VRPLLASVGGDVNDSVRLHATPSERSPVAGQPDLPNPHPALCGIGAARRLYGRSGDPGRVVELAGGDRGHQPIAVTNPGVVLVLEAASSQLSAFDLNGNPVRYFGDPPDYTLPLVSEGTYLDLAVDGAEQIYALYFTGDGATPEDYHVDVCTRAGNPLDTHSPGVNVPHLAVDYWRSIYAANYSPLTNQGTTEPHIDPALHVAEPSLSRFDPTEPT
jgi:hypothetical protein